MNNVAKVVPQHSHIIFSLKQMLKHSKCLSLGEIKLSLLATIFMYAIDSRNKGRIFKDGLIFI